MNQMRWWMCLIGLLILILPGCRKPIPIDQEIILDNSKSLQALTEQVAGFLNKLAQDSVVKCKTGDGFKLMAFNPPSDPYRQKIYVIHRFRIKPPAMESRQEQIQALTAKIAQALQTMPQVDQTPLLESISFLGDLSDRSQDREWNMTVVSDLMQTSPNLTMSLTYLANHSDWEIVDRMSQIAKPPKVAPRKVVVFWYPGLINQSKAIEPEIHERVRAIWKSFLQEWAGPKTQIIFNPIEEV